MSSRTTRQSGRTTSDRAAIVRQTRDLSVVSSCELLDGLGDVQGDRTVVSIMTPCNTSCVVENSGDQ